SGSVSQRPGMACAISDWLHEIAERTARARNDNEVAFDGHSASAMDPNRLRFALASNAIVAAVPKLLCFGSECFSEASRDEHTIDFGPAHSQVMIAEISGSGETFGIATGRAISFRILTEDGFAQTARAAVDQHNHLLFAEAELFECRGIQNFF